MTIYNSLEVGRNKKVILNYICIQLQENIHAKKTTRDRSGFNCLFLTIKVIYDRFINRL